MAVYTEVSDDQLAVFFGRYALGRVLSFKGIAEGVENSNYLVHAENGYFILTLYEKRVEQKDLPYFLHLLKHLAEGGINCPQPVEDKSGNCLNELASRPAALFTFIEGLAVRRPSVSHCSAIGATLAQLHLVGSSFPMQRANALSVIDWRTLVWRTQARADEVQPGLAALIEDEISFLLKSWPEHLPSGVIHADLFPDNAFFLSGKLSGVIDFYFACNDLLAYDLSVCLNSWCFELDQSFNLTKGMAMLAAYQAQRKLSREEAAALPILARGSALRFLLTRLFDWLNVPPGAFVRPKDPLEYAAKLRFHQCIGDAAAYGLHR